MYLRTYKLVIVGPIRLNSPSIPDSVELTYRTDYVFQAHETSQLVNLQAFLVKQFDWNHWSSITSQSKLNKNQIQRVIQKAENRIFENIKIRKNWQRPKRSPAWCQNIFQKLHLERKFRLGFTTVDDGFIQIRNVLLSRVQLITNRTIRTIRYECLYGI